MRQGTALLLIMAASFAAGFWLGYDAGKQAGWDACRQRADAQQYLKPPKDGLKP